jgi:hypothetical protein
MSQPGYTSCPGCGRLFKEDHPAEMAVLDKHDCDWDDMRLDREIGVLTRRLISRIR